MSARRRREARTKAEVRIDLDAWARVYGIDPADRLALVTDAQEWAFNLLTQAAEESGVLAGEASDWAHDE